MDNSLEDHKVRTGTPSAFRLLPTIIGTLLLLFTLLLPPVTFERFDPIVSGTLPITLPETIEQGEDQTTRLTVSPEGALVLLTSRQRVYRLQGGGMYEFLTEFITGGTLGSELRDIAAGPDGVLYAVDGARGKLLRASNQGVPMDPIDLVPFAPYSPNGIAVGRSGTLFAADTGMNRVLALDSSGRLLRVLGAEGIGPEQYRQPTSISLDSRENLFVADSVNRRIVSVDSTGKHRWTADLAGTPRVVAVDSWGQVYVAVQGFEGLVILDGRGGRTATITEDSAGRPLGEVKLLACSGERVFVGGQQGLYSLDMTQRVSTQIDNNVGWRLVLALVALSLVHFYPLRRLLSPAALPLRASRLASVLLPLLGMLLVRVRRGLGLARGQSRTCKWSILTAAMLLGVATQTSFVQGLGRAPAAGLLGLAAITGSLMFAPSLGRAMPGDGITDRLPGARREMGRFLSSRLQVAVAFATFASVALLTLLEVARGATDNPLSFGIWPMVITLCAVWANGTGRVCEQSNQLRATASQTTQPSRVVELVILATIAVTAALLRLVDLEQIPPMLHQDPGEQGLWALRVLRGESGGFFGEGYAGAPNFTFGLSAAGVWLFGETALGIRSVSALVGILSVLVTYLWAKNAFGYRVAFLTSVMLAFSQFHIHYSRDGCFYIQSVLTMALAAYWYCRAVSSGKGLHFFVLGCCLALGWLVYYAGRIAVVVVAIFEFYLLLRKQVSLRTRLHAWFLVASGFAVVSFPWAIHYLKSPEGLLHRSQVVLIFNPQQMKHLSLVHHTSDPLAILAIELKNTLEMFNFRGDSATQWGWQGAFLDPWSGAAFAIGVAVAFLRIRDARYAFCLLWLAAVVLVGGVLTGGMPYSPRMVVLLPVVFVFPAIVVDQWLQYAVDAERSGYRSSAFRVAGMVVACIVLGQIAVTNYNNYFTTYSLKQQPADTVTMLARQVREVPRDYDLYLVSTGGEDRYLQHSTVLYLGGRRDGVETDRFTKLGISGASEAGRRLTIIVLGPKLLSEGPLVEQGFPLARISDQMRPDGQLVFRSYTVD